MPDAALETSPEAALALMLPNVAPPRVRPGRISLSALDSYLEDLAPSAPAANPPTPAETEAAPAPWQEACGLVAAAARHKARRELRQHMTVDTMLEVVDIGRAFPSPGNSSPVEGTPTRGSARTTPFMSPLARRESPLIGCQPDEVFLSPATTTSLSRGTTPTLSAHDPATPCHSSDKLRAGATQHTRNSSEGESPPKVSQRAFVRLMGYNTKSSAALQSQMRAKWWSSHLETPRRSSASMPVRSSLFMHARPSPFYSPPFFILTRLLSSSPRLLQTPLLESKTVGSPRSASVPPLRRPSKNPEDTALDVSDPPPQPVEPLAPSAALLDTHAREPITRTSRLGPRAQLAAPASSPWHPEARLRPPLPPQAAATTSITTDAADKFSTRRESARQRVSPAWSRESRLGRAPSTTTTSSGSSTSLSSFAASTSESPPNQGACNTELQALKSMTGSRSSHGGPRHINDAATRAAWYRTAGAPTPPRMRRSG